jgi:hypothetical protein
MATQEPPTSVISRAARANLSDMSGGKRLLISTVAFRNEPYQ